MSKKDIKFVPKLNADLELKQLGTIRGLTIYVDMAGERFDEEKFQSFLVVQKIMADFFNPPKKEDELSDE